MRKYFCLLLFIPSLIYAQFYSFGRNKVQYDKFNWKTLKTEHFNIYYYDDFEEIAEIGAQYAEEAYNDHKVKFNHVVTNKIPLIFYNTHNHFEQTNTIPGFIPEGVGGFFEFMKGRVVIPHLGSLEQFRHVIRHELVHVFMTNKIYNILTDHRVPSEKLPPLWFVEGLAEYWSTTWDTQSEMVMRDAVLNGIFVSLKDFDLIYGSYLMYKEGQQFLKFVSEEYGEDKILAMMENFWRFSNFNDVIEFTLGEKINQIDEKWIYKIRQRYFPLYNVNHPHTINSKRITEMGFNFSPRVYTNNSSTEIYFVGNHYGYSSLMKINYKPDSLDTFKPEILIEGERDYQYEAFHLMENSIDVSSSGTIAFTTKSLGKDVIHLYSIQNQEVENTLRFEELVRIKAPKFSKDASKLLFSATDQKGFSDIYLYQINDKVLTRLTNDYYEDLDPVFNPIEDKIIFASDRTSGIFNQKNNLFEYHLASKEIRYLTYVNANISTPLFSPNGKELFFTSDYDGTYNIWKMDYNNSPSNGMNKVSNYLTSVYGFSFLDNNKVITSGFEKFSFQLYSLDICQLSDTLKKYVSFKTNDSPSRWFANKLALNSEYDRMVYENEYNLDYVISQFATDPVYGTRGGAILTLSDLLGNDRYTFMLYNSAEVKSEILKSFNLSISHVSLKERTNFGYGLFNYTGRRYDIRDSDEFYYERVFGGYVSLFYPLSSFQRIETEVSFANSSKDIFEQLISRKAVLLTNSISFVHDNSLWYATGPIDGSRFRLQLAYTTDVKFSNVNYFSVIADYRHYLRLGERTTVAVRGALLYNQGKEARRYLGGGSWDIRGWPMFSLRGEKMWLSSVELRFPLIDRILINFPIFGLGFFNIRGAAYFDAGSAWDTVYKQTYGSLGFGIRVNIFNAFALRYDIGKKIQNNFKSFQETWYYQFFFGWDF